MALLAISFWEKFLPPLSLDVPSSLLGWEGAFLCRGVAPSVPLDLDCAAAGSQGSRFAGFCGKQAAPAGHPAKRWRWAAGLAGCGAPVCSTAARWVLPETPCFWGCEGLLVPMWQHRVTLSPRVSGAARAWQGPAGRVFSGVSSPGTQSDVSFASGSLLLLPPGRVRTWNVSVGSCWGQCPGMPTGGPREALTEY